MNAQQAIEQGYELGQGVQQDAHGRIYQCATRYFEARWFEDMFFPANTYTIKVDAENPDTYTIEGKYFDPKVQQEHLKIKIFATNYDGKRRRV